MKIRAAQNKTLVKLDPPDDKIGSILLPENMRKDSGYLTGTIVSIGPGDRNDKSPTGFDEPIFKVGQKIVFDRHYSDNINQLNMNGDKHIFIDSYDIQGMIED